MRKSFVIIFTEDFFGAIGNSKTIQIAQIQYQMPYVYCKSSSNFVDLKTKEMLIDHCKRIR